MRKAFVLISSAPNDWANVFAPHNGVYERYGYNVSKHRWAYEIEPPQSETIGKKVVEFSRR